MLIEVIERFRYSPNGIRVDTYEVGARDVDERIAEFAFQHAFGKPAPVAEPSLRKMIRGAPRNK